MEHVGIVGFGNMGEAIAAGLKRAEPKLGLLVMDPVEAKQRLATEQYGARLVADAKSMFDTADITVIAVKPQVMPRVLEALSSHSIGKRIVGIAAGVPLLTYSSQLKTGEVVRFMPNLAATVGKALVGVSYAEPIDSTTVDYAFRIADSIGDRLVIEEHLMAAITGLSGSGIAYVFAFAHAMALGGTQAGLPYDDALKAAVSAIGGAAELLRGGNHPIDLLSKVTSPGGTTIAGVALLEEGRFTATVMSAVVAAAKRAVELEG